MDVKYLRFFSSILVAASCSTFAQSDLSTQGLNHEYAYAQLSAGSLNENIGVNSDITAFAVGGNYQFKSDFFVGLDYEARFVHPDDVTTEIYTLLPGAFYRLAVHQGLDFIAGAKTGLLWVNQTNDETDKTISKDNRFIWGGHAALRYRLNTRWDLEAEAEFLRSDVLDEEIYTLKADYYLTPRISLGGFYKHREQDSATANEGGIGMQFYY
ncbi:hypothetical protein VISI1226_22390 [Vibrio sinaloensis DSM 21326]|uniref:Uncharacterized protein n=1 Tax=Vibrio sinaloensis DSM 21326 TaxID=945550 RepID=E8M6P8_PHOS4|nr:outer membrane beta-barrel protein [Vibrio sinaloensis]EGA70366.1 hypothetical protein VISI1226_22390 [Vibrio sinaloensis DSM 21326]